MTKMGSCKMYVLFEKRSCLNVSSNMVIPHFVMYACANAIRKYNRVMHSHGHSCAKTASANPCKHHNHNPTTGTSSAYILKCKKNHSLCVLIDVCISSYMEPLVIMCTKCGIVLRIVFANRKCGLIHNFTCSDMNNTSNLLKHWKADLHAFYLHV